MSELESIERGPSDVQANAKLMVLLSDQGEAALRSYHRSIREAYKQAADAGDGPVLTAHRIVRHIFDRATEIADVEWREAAQEVLNAEQFRARILRVARGDTRTKTEKWNNVVTDKMREAEERREESRQRLQEARDHMDELEEEFEACGTFLSRYGIRVAGRRFDGPSLEDRRQLIERQGNRPDPSALDYQAVSHGFVDEE